MTPTRNHRDPYYGPTVGKPPTVSLGRKLFRSHLTIGAVPLLLAVGTTIWVRAYTDQVAIVRIPMADAATRLLMGTERSLSALRGWVVLGET